MNSLVYAMIIIRFDLKFAFSILSRYCFNLNSIYMKVTIRFLRYIKEILHYNIRYENKKNLINYINAN